MNAKPIALTALLVLGIISLLMPAGASAGESDKSETLGPPPIVKLVTGNIGRLLVLKSELGVTNKQKGEIKAIVKKRMSEMAPMLRSVVEQKRKLREAVLADQPNESTIRTAAADLGKSIGETAVMASKVIGEARKNLTKEQVDRLGRFKADQDAAVDRWLAEIGK
jgi:Spy/CpxP family protein refolding chaperone